jgi:hypothetical protein
MRAFDATQQSKARLYATRVRNEKGEAVMGRFTVRVELHQHRPGDYDVLHAEMAAQGFERTITSDDGKTYHMPTAEYNFEGSIEDPQEVLKRAKAAATNVGRAYEVLVTKAERRTWYNLTTV